MILQNNWYELFKNINGMKNKAKAEYGSMTRQINVIYDLTGSWNFFYVVSVQYSYLRNVFVLKRFKFKYLGIKNYYEWNLKLSNDSAKKCVCVCVCAEINQTVAKC